MGNKASCNEFQTSGESSSKLGGSPPQPLVNINVDSIIKQFIDLLGKIDSNKDLIDEANALLSQLPQRKLKINGRHCVLGNQYHLTHKVRTDLIEIYQRDLCLKILRNFGQFIQKLCVDFDGLNERHQFYHQIQNEIMEFCADSLIELELYNCHEISITRPFMELRSLCFHNCILNIETDQWNLLFPAMTRLELLGNTLKDPCRLKECIVQCFPGLQDFTLDIKGRSFAKEQLLAMLCFNQQLSSLHLLACVDTKLLHTISQVTPLLQNLKLQISSYKFGTDTETDADSDNGDGDDGSGIGGVVNFENVETLTMVINQGHFKDMPISFQQLNEFVVTANDGICRSFCHFIGRMKTLQKLTMIAPSWNQINILDDDLENLSQTLTNLTNVTLQRCSISVQAAIAFMKNAKLLKDFRFTLSYEDDEDKNGLATSIGNDWTLTEDENMFHCKRQ